jgi:superfamily II DNA or RNA helicase
VETIRSWKLDHANLQIECESGAAQELNEFFSFFVPGYKFMPAFRSRMWDGKIRLFTMRDKTLPAGLFYHLSEFCEKRGYILETETTDYGSPDERNHISPSDLSLFLGGLNLPFDPRPYQYECVGEALIRKRAILLSPTGSGKSFIIYLIARYWLQQLAKRHAEKILLVVPTTSLVEQMHSDFLSYGWDERSLHRIYSGKDKDFGDAECVITTWQSIYKLPKIWFEQFGCVFGDECHGFKSKSLMNIMNKCSEAEYRFGTTGTLDGSQTHELVLQGLFGKVFRVTTTKSLQDNDTLAKLKITRLVLTYSDEVRQNFGKQAYQDELNFYRNT